MNQKAYSHIVAQTKDPESHRDLNVFFILKIEEIESCAEKFEIIAYANSEEEAKQKLMDHILGDLLNGK